MGCHQPTKDYVARRTAEGKTKTEIMRCLKRYIAREVYPHLTKLATAQARHHAPRPRSPLHPGAKPLDETGAPGCGGRQR